MHLLYHPMEEQVDSGSNFIGDSVGNDVGFLVILSTGDVVGLEVIGDMTGLTDGFLLRFLIGLTVGLAVGLGLGFLVRRAIGAIEGVFVGADVSPSTYTLTLATPGVEEVSNDRTLNMTVFPELPKFEMVYD